MANIPLQSISFPGLSDKYTTPTVDTTLTQTGAAADAKKTGDELTGLKNDFTQLEDKVEDAYNAYVVETEAGSIASFTDGADDVPVKDLTVAIEPVQSGSGDPSPSNVRPISGWTGANVTVNDEVLSINWETEAGTVYGGTLDVTTGVLTVDTTRYKFTGSEAYTQLSGSVAIKTGLVLKSTGDGYCTDFEFNGTGSTNFIYLKTTLTAEDLKTYMGNHDVYAVVVLAQAQTYQLTAHEVSTILGQNNIFADTGNVTVQYRADTKLYIDKVLNA